MSGTKAWGSFSGKAETSKHAYLSLNQKGAFSIRIVSGVLPRYVYWIENKSLGISASFDSFRFNRSQEKFNNSLPDPIQDMHITQFNKFSKKTEEIKSRRNYLCWVLDRQDGSKMKLMELKSSLNDSINEMMGQLYADGLKSPMMIDLEISRIGEGKDTRYSVNIVKAMKDLAKLQDPASDVARAMEKDYDVIGQPIYDGGSMVAFEKVPDLSTEFPAPYDPTRDDSIEAAAEAQRREVEEFLAKIKDDGNQNKPEESARANDLGAGEAAADL
ncbi:hypothetical protein [Providencia phage PSTCR5]|uniref:Uncharacterized protein n=1 Tax=Providencia phage PSTCR5 TaxID=2783547 RepID=A0A873WX20_9CAUD|nr:single strand DNA binding protein [Providencia phage PSTCR5]QPB12117.1 hypothetical protein [Providencia phage PSTCR5]